MKEQFPPGTEAPLMLPITSAVSWLLKFSLQSDKVALLDLRTLCDWDIRNRLLAIPGIASVVCMGPGPKQYQVLLSSTKLLQYNITVKNVIEALRETNRNVPGGFNVVQGQEFVVTGVGRITSWTISSRPLLPRKTAYPIPLERVAEVRFGPEFPRGDSAFMGKPAIIGTVSKLFGADTLTGPTRSKRRCKRSQRLARWRGTPHPGLPTGHLHRVVHHQPAAALIEGAVIVTIVVVFFLFNVRASIITLTAMPLCLLMGLLVLKIFGVGINAMTLGGTGRRHRRGGRRRHHRCRKYRPPPAGKPAKTKS